MSTVEEQPVRSPADWATRRAHIVAAMQQVMGPLPTVDKRIPLDPQMMEATVVGGYVRRRLTIAVEPGDRLPVIVLIPTQRSGKMPAVVCLHPTNRPLGKMAVAGKGERENDRGLAPVVRVAPRPVKSAANCRR